MLALTEPTIDAITELLSSESRYAKFRPSDYPPSGQMSPLSIETVLTEVERRRQVLRQLAPVVTADSPIVRFAPRDPPSFQVSASQWALLVRTGDGSTPRTLAMALGRSVFGTTIEVYRLLALGLLVVPGHAQAITSGRPANGRPRSCRSCAPYPTQEAAMPRDAALTDQIGEELKLIRQHVPGVRGSVAATSDGILIAHDVTTWSRPRSPPWSRPCTRWRSASP